jgi:hypothetical protein
MSSARFPRATSDPLPNTVAARGWSRGAARKRRKPGRPRDGWHGYPRAPRPPRCYPTPFASCARCLSGTWPPSRRKGRRPPGAPPPSRIPRPALRRTRTRRAWAASPRALCAPCCGPRRTRGPGGRGAGARTPRTAFRTGRGQAGARCRRCGSRGHPLPGPRAVRATTRAAGHDAGRRARLHRLCRARAVSGLTLVTLDSTPFDIAMSVDEANRSVYPSRVLPLWDQT